MQYFNEIKQLVEKEHKFPINGGRRDNEQVVLEKLKQRRACEENSDSYINEEVDKIMNSLDRKLDVPGDRATNALQNVVFDLVEEINKETKIVNEQMEKRQDYGLHLGVQLYLQKAFFRVIYGALKKGVYCSDGFIKSMITYGVDDTYILLMELKDTSQLIDLKIIKILQELIAPSLIDIEEPSILPPAHDPAPRKYDIPKQFIKKIYSTFNDLLVSVDREQWREAMLSANFKGVASQCSKQKLAYLISRINMALRNSRVKDHKNWYRESVKSIGATTQYSSGRGNYLKNSDPGFYARCKDIENALP